MSKGMSDKRLDNMPTCAKCGTKTTYCFSDQWHCRKCDLWHTSPHPWVFTAKYQRLYGIEPVDVAGKTLAGGGVAPDTDEGGGVL